MREHTCDRIDICEHTYERPQTHIELSEEPFCMDIYRHSAAHTFILCRNLQEQTDMEMSAATFCVEIYRQNATPARDHLDQTWAPLLLSSEPL